MAASASFSSSNCPVTVGGRVLGMSKNVVTSPFRTGSRRVLEVFLVRQSRLAEMHLVVDHTGQQIQSGRIDRNIRRDLARRIDVGDPGPLDQHRGPAATFRQYDRGILDPCFHGTRRSGFGPWQSGEPPRRGSLHTQFVVAKVALEPCVARARGDLTADRTRTLGRDWRTGGVASPEEGIRLCLPGPEPVDRIRLEQLGYRKGY